MRSEMKLPGSEQINKFIRREPAAMDAVRMLVLSSLTRRGSGTKIFPRNWDGNSFENIFRETGWTINWSIRLIDDLSHRAVPQQE